MAIDFVRFGDPTSLGKGLRVGTVRHPPRGVPKAEYAARAFYDTWMPELAPSAELMSSFRAGPFDERRFRDFAKHYRAEMSAPAADHLLGLLAALSHRVDLAVGCYCEDESRCHRSLLRELLALRGAAIREP